MLWEQPQPSAPKATTTMAEEPNTKPTVAPVRDPVMGFLLEWLREAGDVRMSAVAAAEQRAAKAANTQQQKEAFIEGLAAAAARAGEPEEGAKLGALPLMHPSTYSSSGHSSRNVSSSTMLTTSSATQLSSSANSPSMRADHAGVAAALRRSDVSKSTDSEIDPRMRGYSGVSLPQRGRHLVPALRPSLTASVTTTASSSTLTTRYTMQTRTSQGEDVARYGSRSESTKESSDDAIPLPRPPHRTPSSGYPAAAVERGGHQLRTSPLSQYNLTNTSTSTHSVDHGSGTPDERHGSSTDPINAVRSPSASEASPLPLPPSPHVLLQERILQVQRAQRAAIQQQQQHRFFDGPQAYRLDAVAVASSPSAPGVDYTTAPIRRRTTDLLPAPSPIE